MPWFPKGYGKRKITSDMGTEAHITITANNLILQNRIKRTRVSGKVCPERATVLTTLVLNLLKTELLYLQEFMSVEHFISELTEYIEWYNNKRIKLKLDGLSPVDYRHKAA